MSSPTSYNALSSLVLRTIPTGTAASGNGTLAVAKLATFGNLDRLRKNFHSCKVTSVTLTVDRPTSGRGWFIAALVPSGYIEPVEGGTSTYSGSDLATLPNAQLIPIDSAQVAGGAASTISLVFPPNSTGELNGIQATTEFAVDLLVAWSNTSSTAASGSIGFALSGSLECSGPGYLWFGESGGIA